MITNVIIAYVGLMLTTAIHESIHSLMAKVFNIEICEICIGYRGLAARVTDKLYISPLPCGGYVVTYENELSSMNIVRVGMFYLLSTLANIMVAVISINLFIHTGIAALMFIGSYNLGISIYNLLPFFSGNDMNGLLNIRKLQMS